MGSAKNEQIENEQKVQYAVGLCLEFGAIKECSIVWLIAPNVGFRTSTQPTGYLTNKRRLI
jgi:hypothetical protein